MKTHTYEKAFLGVGAGLLVLCAAALVFATTAMGMHLTGHGGTIDPKLVAQTPPFDTPGVRQSADGNVEVVFVGQMWSFAPAEITVPVNKEITFIGTSPDVIHGFAVEGTRLNMMLIPGQIARVNYTFRAPGEYLIVCHEYCGLAHHTMHAKVIVK